MVFINRNDFRDLPAVGKVMERNQVIKHGGQSLMNLMVGELNNFGRDASVRVTTFFAIRYQFHYNLIGSRIETKS